jgi:PAS domain S-box-containing protein
MLGWVVVLLLPQIWRHDWHPWALLFLGFALTGVWLAYLVQRGRMEREIARSEARYRILVDTMNDPLGVLDQEGRVVYLNPRMVEAFGYSVEEVLGRKVFDFVAEGSREDMRAQMEARPRGASAPYELFWQRKSGEQFPGMVSPRPIYDEEGNFRGSFAIIRDMTHQRRAEEALARSERQYRTLVESLNDGLGMLDENGIPTYVNARMCEMLGCSAEELLGHTPDRFFDEESQQRFAAQRAARRSGADGRYELDLRNKKGKRITVLISGRPILDETGTFRGSFALMTDITERKRVEEALRDAIEELEAMFDAYPDLSFRLAADGTVLSHRAGKKTGLYRSPEEFTGRRIPDYVPTPVSDWFRRAIDEVGKTQSVVTIEYSLPIAGEEQILEGRLCPLPNGEILFLVRNITRRKRMEETLAASEERYRSLVESINEGVAVMDEHGITTYANPRICQMLGCSKEELENHPADRFYDEKSRQRFLATRVDRRRGTPESYELVLRTKTGEAVPVLISEQPIMDETGTYRGSVGVITEITDLKRVEDALRQAKAELEAMFDAYPDMSFRLAADGTVLDFRAGPSARERMFLTPEQFLGKRGYEVLPQPGGERLREAIAKVGETGSQVTIEYPLPRPEGIEIREARLSPLPNGEILVVVRDITERKQAEEQLNALSLRLLTAQEDERQRIAHDLHDEFGQLLAVSKFEAHELCKKLTAERQDLREVADRLHRAIERAIDTMRTIQRGLYPTVLDHLGLGDAIETLVNEFQERTGVACILDMDAEPIEVDAERARALYRIVQEALTNAVRHSGASQVEIALQRNGSHLRLEIRDDGRGIDAADLSALNSYGLMGMRKRAELCGGSMEIRGEPGEGTVITVDVPLEPLA